MNPNILYFVICTHKGARYIPERDTADMNREATLRDLRSGELQDVVSVIEIEFADTGISSRDVTISMVMEAALLNSMETPAIDRQSARFDHNQDERKNYQEGRMFRVGMKVVCVDDRNNSGLGMDWREAPVKGHIYTVKKVGLVHPYDPRGLPAILVYELNRDEMCPLWSHRFRPITDTKTETSFTEGAPKDSRKWDNRRKQKERARA